MAKYMILYRTSQTAQEQMANATPEQIQRSMAEWMAWRADAEKVARVEFRSPLQAVNRVTPSGISGPASDISGYAFVEGDSKEDILTRLATHPHLKRPDASIDVLEIQHMPGIDVPNE